MPPTAVVPPSAGREVKLGETLLALIKSHGYHRDRQAILDAVGISGGALSQYTTGRTRPSFDKLVALAAFFDVSLDHLVFGEPCPHHRDGLPEATLAATVDRALTEARERAERHGRLVASIGTTLAGLVDVAAADALAAEERAVSCPRPTAATAEGEVDETAAPTAREPDPSP